MTMCAVHTQQGLHINVHFFKLGNCEVTKELTLHSNRNSIADRGSIDSGSTGIFSSLRCIEDTGHLLPISSGGS